MERIGETPANEEVAEEKYSDELKKLVRISCYSAGSLAVELEGASVSGTKMEKNHWSQQKT